MNHPNPWFVEQMVKHEMQEVDRAVAQARLLKEAGLSRPGLLARGIQALRSFLKVRTEQVKRQPDLEHEPYRLSEKTECEG